MEDVEVPDVFLARKTLMDVSFRSISLHSLVQHVLHELLVSNKTPILLLHFNTTAMTALTITPTIATTMTTTPIIIAMSLAFFKV